jgi:predicted dehydrogenase
MSPRTDGRPRIGLLSAAHLHVDAYVANLRAAGADVVGLTDDDPGRGQAWCAAHDVPWFDRAERLLDANLDGVVVCSETADHRRDVEAAAAAGVGVLCEKPLATTEEDAAALVAACATAGVPLLTAFPMRFSAPMREVRELLATGSLGQVYAAMGTNQGELPMRHRAWFVEPTRSGGGALMDHVVHLTDVLRWYLDAEVTEVFATTNRILHAPTVTVETGGLVMLAFDSGVFASIDCSWSKPDVYPTWGGLRLDLVGERGIVGVDAFAQRLTVHGGPEGPLAWPAWGSDANQGLIDDLVAVLRDGAVPSVTGEDGLAATRVALAAARSAASGAPVRLDHREPGR